MLGDASFDICACGGGEGAILFGYNVCCLTIDKKMLRIVHKKIIQGYLKNADGVF